MRATNCPGRSQHCWVPKKVKGKPWNPKCAHCGLSRREAGYGKPNPKRCPSCGCDLGGYSSAELRIADVAERAQRSLTSLRRFDESKAKKRDGAIREARNQGSTYTQLETLFGITRERCRQICDAGGLPKLGRGRRPSKTLAPESASAALSKANGSNRRDQ